EILSLINLFDRQAIPPKFLSYNKQQHAGEPITEIQFVKALGVLKAFSFITEDKDHNLDMHRLVQLVTRKWLANRGTIQRFTGQALLAVSQAYPYGNYENHVICGAYLPHAQAVLDSKDTGFKDERVARASLLHCVAGFFSSQGQWKDAERFQLNAIKWRKAVLDNEHPDTLNSIANLASTHQNQGRWKEAETLGVQGMDMRKKVLGNEHPSTLNSVQVMKMYKKVLGDEHPDTLTSMNNLAYTWKSQGRYEDALTLLQNCLHLQQQKLGPDHPNTISTHTTLTHWTKETTQTP
ncbi:hypothetical protein B0H67DRAFT_576503, partial [Lasiosphaeris hirsuta]